MKTKFKLIETEQDFRDAVGKSIVWIGDTKAGVSDTCNINNGDKFFGFNRGNVEIEKYLRGHSWVKEIYVVEFGENIPDYKETLQFAIDKIEED